MATTFTEGFHTGEFLLSEAPLTRSREQVTFTNAGALAPSGTVVGLARASGNPTATAKAGNTGTGVMGTITASAGARPGRYTLLLTGAGATAAFVVQDPDGFQVGVGAVGTAFSAGGLAFTLADGTPDYAIGDVIFIDVAPGKWKLYNPANTDGSQFAAGILYNELESFVGDQRVVIIARDAEVTGDALTNYGADAGAKAVTKAALASLGIIVR